VNHIATSAERDDQRGCLAKIRVRDTFSKMAAREFAAGTAFQIVFESSRFDLGSKGNSRFNLPWTVLRSMSAFSTIVLFNSGGQIAREGRSEISASVSLTRM
jgi:hypothetical protein